MSKPWGYSLTIKEHHIDTLGHVNNAMYLQLLEEARWQTITEKGFGMAHMSKTKQGPVILEVNLKFLKELTLRETVTITTEILDYAGKIGHMKQQIIKSDGSVSAEAVFTFGLFDLRERKLILPTEAWKIALSI